MTPCDSENHRFCECDGCNDRIRELEAELTQSGRALITVTKAGGGWKARAEEAKARLHDELVRLGETVDALKIAEARAEKSEKERDDWKECAESMQQECDSVKARVAELDGLVKDYELWALEMGRTPIAREREE